MDLEIIFIVVHMKVFSFLFSCIKLPPTKNIEISLSPYERPMNMSLHHTKEIAWSALCSADFRLGNLDVSKVN